MTLATRIADLATRIATETKSIRTLLNGNAPDLTALNTTAKANLVLALNEVVAAAASKAAIDDTAAATTKVYSSSKTTTLINQAVANLVATSPAALDTLKELADAIGDDPNYAATTATALGNRLRVDAAQAFTSGQQTQGRSNLDVYGTTQLGDPETNFVTVFTSGLA